MSATRLPAELDAQDGIRLLGRLAEKGALLRHGPGPGNQPDTYRIALADEREEALGAEARLIPELLRSGLIAMGDGGLMLTASGAMHVRRWRASAAAAAARDATKARPVPRPALAPSQGRPQSAPSRAPLLDEAESPLGWLRRRKDKAGRPLIGDDEFAAGERLRADMHFGQLTQKVTSSWDPAAGAVRSGRRGGQRADDLSDNALAARERVNAALRAVGPDLSGILIDVCGYLKGLETIEREREWPLRSAKVVLDLALRALVRHYRAGRLAPRDDSTPPARALHWGTEDYRPTLDGWS